MKRKKAAAPKKKPAGRRAAPRAVRSAAPAKKTAPAKKAARGSSGPSLFRIAVHVTDLDRAVSFYTRLMGIDGRSTGGARCYFDCGPVILAVLDVSRDSKSPQPLPTVYFSVGDLEAIHARAREMGCLDNEDVHGAPGGTIATRPWGERSFYAEDPFGNSLCFVDSTTLFTGRR
ncbi:MAG TPA: VOC family protein [Thermoanaerobaculia bacterium]|jgi:catechol 2,3-dioxygenase-like lactoylglutathione lyase family enzyme